MKTFIVTLMLFLLKGWEVHAPPVQSEATESQPWIELIKPLMAISNQNRANNVTENLQQKFEALGSQVEEQMVMLKDRMVSLFDMEGAISNQNRANNVTENLQQKFEALGSQMEEQMVMMKDRMVSLFDMEGAISNQNLPNSETDILQQRFEALGSQVEEQMVMVKDKMVSLFAQFHTDIGLPKRPASTIIQQLEALKTNISHWAVSAVPDNTSPIFPDNVREEFNQKMEQLQQLFIPLISTVQERFKEGIANLRRSITPGIQEIKKLVTESEPAK